MPLIPSQATRDNRRRMPYPGDEAISAAYGRARKALSEVLTALGEGTHRLTYMAEDADGVPVLCSVQFEFNGSVNLPHLTADRDEARDVHAALTVALIGTCTRTALLFAQSSKPYGPVVCGWQITGRWLHPMPRPAVQLAVDLRPEFENGHVYEAPSIPAPVV